MRLQKRVALVTGGSSGIGRGIALEFASEGARVAVSDVREKPKPGKYYERDLETTTVEEIDKLGQEAAFIEADLSDEVSTRKMIHRTVALFGGIDILVNNAGILIPGGCRELSVADWDRTLAVDLRGVYVAIKFALPHLEKSRFGRIINIASVLAFGGGGGPAYSAAKAGVVNLTRDVALEAAQQGITVNAICPGYIETPIQNYQSEEDIANCRLRTPLPRFGTPRDVARAALFLASDEADWVTGIALPVDGGWMAKISE
ncbi:MAG: SDR family NAD(P)-dependent oxidoreductase [Acidobacteriota bacterium]